MNTQTTNENPLGSQPVKKLLMQFAIPSILLFIPSRCYYIVVEKQKATENACYIVVDKHKIRFVQEKHRKP